jgi:hypothetical protein
LANVYDTPNKTQFHRGDYPQILRNGEPELEVASICKKYIQPIDPSQFLIVNPKTLHGSQIVKLIQFEGDPLSKHSLVRKHDI